MHRNVLISRYKEFAMGHIEIEFWEILLHISVLILLCATVLYLIRERANKNRSMMLVHTEGNLGRFSEEILSQLIRQQAERALETIYDTVEREKRFLKEMIEKEKTDREDRAAFQERVKQTPMQFYEENGEGAVRSATATGPIPFQEGEKVKDSGVNSEDLPKKAGIPKGELLLMEKLERYAHDNDSKDIIRDRIPL
jgi:hypothetical protein